MEDRDGARERNESQRERVEKGRDREREKRGETEREEGWGLELCGRAQKSTVNFLRYITRETSIADDDAMGPGRRFSGLAESPPTASWAF